MTFKEYSKDLNLENKKVITISSIGSDLDLKGISEFKNIRILRITDCAGLITVNELPPKINTLELIRCSNLKEFSCDFPESLEVIRINSSPYLSEIPFIPDNLVNLHLENCKEIKILPNLPKTIKYIWVENSGIEKFADDFDFDLDINGSDFRGTPIYYKYKLTNDDTPHFYQLKIYLNLQAGNDLRGVASIMDTGLFDFKQK